MSHITHLRPGLKGYSDRRGPADAEVAVIGGILLDNGAIDRLSGQLAADDFATKSYSIVYSTALDLRAKGQPVDPVTLSDRLEAAGLFDEAGGMEALIRLNEAVATASNITHHAGIVRQYADRRRLKQTALEIAARVDQDMDADPSKLIDEGAQHLLDLNTKRASRAMTRVGDGVDASQEHMRAAVAGEVPPSKPTGLADLDAAMPLRNGTLNYVAGRPKMGKTSLALKFALATAEAGYSVAIFSLEMNEIEIRNRLWAILAGVDERTLTTGDNWRETLPRLLNVKAKLKALPIFVDDTPSISVDEARAKARRVAADSSCPPLGLVIVDYLQLMTDPRGKESRLQEVSSCSRKLKEMAKQLQVPVVSLAQLNRDCEKRPDKRPMVSDLRESGQLEQDADNILMVYRDEVYDEESKDAGIAELLLRATRSGTPGTVKVNFKGEGTQFRDLARGGVR